MNPLGTPYKSYLAIPIVVVISVLVTDIFYHNPSHAVGLAALFFNFSTPYIDSHGLSQLSLRLTRTRS